MPFVLSVGKKLKAQEHTTFCWFPLSLNNPFVDRCNGHWNSHNGLADYVFELILCLSCISFSFSLQSLMPIKTWLLPFRKNFETILICLLSDQRKFCHIHSKCHRHHSPPVADFSPVFCHEVWLFLKNVLIVRLLIHFSFAQAPFMGDKVLHVLWYDQQLKQTTFGEVYWWESRI